MGKCKLGAFCNFAHGESEIGTRISLKSNNLANNQNNNDNLSMNQKIKLNLEKYKNSQLNILNNLEELIIRQKLNKVSFDIIVNLAE